METKAQQLADRLLDFVVRIIKIVDTLPNTVTARHIGGQLTNAVTSCGANYEEGCGAESRPDFIHKMSIVLKELKETRFWLRLIHRTRLISSGNCEPAIDECEQLCAIIARSIITAKNKKNSR
jgi:four helix bundle protein